MVLKPWRLCIAILRAPPISSTNVGPLLTRQKKSRRKIHSKTSATACRVMSESLAQSKSLKRLWLCLWPTKESLCQVQCAGQLRIDSWQDKQHRCTIRGWETVAPGSWPKQTRAMRLLTSLASWRTKSQLILLFQTRAHCLSTLVELQSVVTRILSQVPFWTALVTSLCRLMGYAAKVWRRSTKKTLLKVPLAAV